MRSAASPALLGTLLLVGCAAPAPPAGPSEAEIGELLEQQTALYWETIAPGEPMPDVEPVQVVDDYTEQWAAVRGCISDLDIEGLEADPDTDYWVVTSDDPEFMEVFERAQWVCAAQYPVDPGSPDHEFTLTEEQSRYLWDFYTTRLIPCFQAHGYSLGQIPSRGEFLSAQWWSPYFALSQSPITAHDLATLDAVCPPPPIPVQRPF